MKRDLYQDVTDRILRALETGTVPWLRPWRDNNCGSGIEPYNAISGRQYSGINLLILGTMPFSELGWITYNQAKTLGANLKGEHGSNIVFWKFNLLKDEKTDKMRTVPLARGYTVFNISQCRDLDTSKLKHPVAPTPGDTSVNRLAARVGATVKHGGNRAFYTTQGDFIQIPSVETFKTVEHYQATLAHELTHWTGHDSRCNRQFGKRFGDQAYAFEELVAEIGSAFLCAKQGIPLEQLQHPAYVKNWLEVLRSDKRAIFTASSKAKQGTTYLVEERQEVLAA